MPENQQARRREEKMVNAQERTASALEKIARTLEKKTRDTVVLNENQVVGTVKMVSENMMAISLNPDVLIRPNVEDEVLVIFRIPG